MKGLAGAALAVVAALGVSAASAQTCNVKSKSVEVFALNAFAQDEVEVLSPPGAVVDGKLRMAIKEEIGGSATQIYLKERQRLADGFIATFDFKMDGTGDGLAFLVQNYKTSDTVHQTRNSLGFVNGVRQYIAVAMLACPDDAAGCNTQELVIYQRNLTSDAVEVARSPVPANLLINATTGRKCEFVYKADEEMVEVSLDGTLIVSGNVGNLEENFGDRFGWMGFSASTSYTATPFFLTADVEVTSLRLDVQPSDTAVLGEIGETVDWGKSHFFKLSKRDSCQKPVAFPKPETATVTALLWYAGEVGATYTRPETPLKNRDFFEAQIEYNNAEKAFILRYDLPFRVTGKWDLEVIVNDVEADGSPYESAVITKEPEPPSGIPTWGLALLITIIVLIVIGLIYAIIRLKRYQKKLKDNKEDIEAGKEKHHLDILERDVSFNMNPMLGSLDEMKQKLAENEAELERLRSGKSDLYDDDHTISKLQEQNAELREEMNKLKKEAQQNEALNSDFRPAPGLGGTVKRKEFEQTRA